MLRYFSFGKNIRSLFQGEEESFPMVSLMAAPIYLKLMTQSLIELV